MVALLSALLHSTCARLQNGFELHSRGSHVNARASSCNRPRGLGSLSLSHKPFAWRIIKKAHDRYIASAQRTAVGASAAPSQHAHGARQRRPAQVVV
eukprot:7273443-Prymnesium_polylepis.2